MGFLAVGVGGALGCWLRWIFGIFLTPLFPTIPLGTLAANLVGCYLIGVAVEVFQINTSLAPELRLLVITGFLGGLTTFSSFSAEVVAHLRLEQYGWAFGTAAIHLAGSLLMTGLGIYTIQQLGK